jgi:enoyl-CoA hydratase/carnithine racemase
VSAAEAEFAASQEAREQALGDAVRAGPDFAEGVAAFAEKRKPDYR